MLGTLESYAMAYLGITETIETVETKRGVVLLKRNRQVFMFHRNWLKRVQFLSITGLFLSSLLSDQLPLKTTLFGGSRFPCVPHSVLPIIRPRDRPSRKAWWIWSTIVKRRVVTVIWFSVPLTYNYCGSLPCNGCIFLNAYRLRISISNRTRSCLRNCSDCRLWKAKLSRDGV